MPDEYGAFEERGPEGEPHAGGEDLKVPKRQPKGGRLWLNDGSCIRLRPLHGTHVWSHDFVTSRTHDGRAFRMLNILDEYTRECSI